MKNTGVISMGIKTPIIREGDDLAKIVADSVLDAMESDVPFHRDGIMYAEGCTELENNDIIGITESIVARAQGNYVTIDEIAEDIKAKINNPDTIVVLYPIYSRNRLSMILKAIARAAAKRVVIVMPDFDEVGNPRGVNPWTGVDIEQYYKDICANENKKVSIYQYNYEFYEEDINLSDDKTGFLYCGLHDYEEWFEQYCPPEERVNETYKHLTLANICSDKCEWGLLGSNKASEERLKLFPNKVKAQKFVEEVQQLIQDTIKERQNTDINVHVCVFGDGCFHSPSNGKLGSSIWEFADPVVSPAYTSGLEGSPNEIKIKGFADDKYKNLNGKELENAIKEEIRNKDKNLVGKMDSFGTTPRKLTDLIGSLCDLTSGSGDRGTPVIIIKHYFNNFGTE